jgi:hypothetical protein
VKSLNQSSDSLSLTPDTDWQILGELELPLNFDPNIAIETWIMDTLSPLGLNAELVRKVLKSAQDSAARARPPESSAQEFEHIDFLALASKDYSSKRSTWGFFRIEKMESSPTGREHKRHSIEFYFYREE